jgi:oxygen-dependent protoporphyrinogen oxidase
MHGIYAGDIDQLSAQTILGALRNFEHCGVLRGLLDSVTQRKWPMFMDDFIAWSAVYRSSKTEEISPVIGKVPRKSSTFTLKGGTQQLAEGLKTALDKSGKVKIMTGTDIKAMTQRQGSDSINVSVSCLLPLTYCRVSLFIDPNGAIRQQSLRPRHCCAPFACFVEDLGDANEPSQSKGPSS